MPFTCFPQFPAELQLKIWREALPGPQTVTIYGAGRRRAKIIVEGLGKSTLKSLYYTCKDSQNTVIANYKRQFYKQLRNPIWFCSDIDTVCFADFDGAYVFLFETEDIRARLKDCGDRIHAKHISFGWPIDVHRGCTDPSNVYSILRMVVLYAITCCPDLEQITYFTEEDFELTEPLIYEEAVDWFVTMGWVSAKYEKKLEMGLVNKFDFELIHVAKPTELA